MDNPIARRPSGSSFAHSIPFRHTRTTSFSSSEGPFCDTSYDTLPQPDRTFSHIDGDHTPPHSVASVPFTTVLKGLASPSRPAPGSTLKSLTALFSRNGTTEHSESTVKLKAKHAVQSALGSAAAISPRPSFSSTRGSRELERRPTRASTESLPSSDSTGATFHDAPSTQSVLTRKSNMVNAFFRTRHLQQPHIKDHNNNSIVISSSSSNSNSKLLNDELFSVRPGVKYTSFNPLASPSGITPGSLKHLNFNNIQKTLSTLELLSPNTPSFAYTFKGVDQKEQLADDLMTLLYAALTPLFENTLAATANTLILSKFPIEDLNNLVTIHFYIRHHTEHLPGLAYIEEIREVFSNGLRLLVESHRYPTGQAAGGNATPVSSVFSLPSPAASNTGDGVLGPYDAELAAIWEYFVSEVLHTLTAILIPLQLEFEGNGVVLRPRPKAQSYWKDLCKVQKVTHLAVDRLLLIMFRDVVVMPMYEKSVAVLQIYPSSLGKSGASEEVSQNLRLLQCFGLLCGIQSADYNQKVMERLLDALKVRTRGS